MIIDDVVGTIQSEIGRMVQEALSVDGDPASPQGPADVVAGREEGSEMIEREPGPAPVQPSSDAGSCVAGTPGCFLVIGVDDCLKLRAYPSLEGEALDCVPNGTNLIEKRGYIPLKTDDNVVWRLFETADGQWLGWAEGRFLHGAGRQSPTRVPLVIPLRTSTDADVCVPGAVLFLDETEPNSAPAALHCLAVVNADYCLKLRTYPSFEGEVLDCVPDGTRLFTQGRSFKREDNVAWYPVGAADGQWLGWAEGRFLQGTRPSGRQPLTIPLRTSTDVDACIPGDLLSFEGPELNLPYGTFFCLAAVGADDCLEIRETPSPDGRKLDCVPDGTRFIVAAEFYDIAAEDTDGVVWRLVRWGDGRGAGWVNNHHLDGPSPNRMVAVVSSSGSGYGVSGGYRPHRQPLPPMPG